MFIRSLFVGFFLLSLAAPVSAGEDSSLAALMADESAVARGQALFGGLCGAYCHGTEPGVQDAPFLFDCEWVHGGNPEQIFQTITNGVQGTRMVSFGGKLPEGDDDIWKIIAYLKSASRCTAE